MNINEPLLKTWCFQQDRDKADLAALRRLEAWVKAGTGRVAEFSVTSNRWGVDTYGPTDADSKDGYGPTLAEAVARALGTEGG